MRKAVRAIIVRGNKLLAMKRNKFGKEYYTLVGGGIDYGESAEQALAREVREESGLTVTDCRLVYIEEAGDPFGTQYIYLCSDNGGDIALSPDSEEAAIHLLGENQYLPVWISIKELAALPFRSETLKQHLLESFKNGFPLSPKTLQPTVDIRYNNSKRKGD